MDIILTRHRSPVFRTQPAICEPRLEGSGANTANVGVMGDLTEFSMESGSENSRPNVWNSCRSSRQISNLELVFPNPLCKFDAADRYCRCLESFEPEHRPNPLFDSAMILLHDIVQVLAGSYPNPAGHRFR
jgi:hypothetical protein